MKFDITKKGKSEGKSALEQRENEDATDAFTASGKSKKHTLGTRQKQSKIILFKAKSPSKFYCPHLEKMQRLVYINYIM